jgi:hypothetical protein
MKCGFITVKPFKKTVFSPNDRIPTTEAYKNQGINIEPNPDNKILSHHSVNNTFSIYYQNIRGLQGKTDELISALYPDLPHLLCLTEYHLNYIE